MNILVDKSKLDLVTDGKSNYHIIGYHNEMLWTYKEDKDLFLDRNGCYRPNSMTQNDLGGLWQHQSTFGVTLEDLPNMAKVIEEREECIRLAKEKKKYKELIQMSLFDLMVS